MITGLAHVCFRVRDLEKSIAYYEALGLRPAFDFVNDQGRRFGLYMKLAGRVFVELFQNDQAAGERPDQSYAHICLEVDDINATAAELRAKGVEVGEPKLGSDQSWQAWLVDPDGNRIELHQYTPESWQTPHLA